MKFSHAMRTVKNLKKRKRKKEHGPGASMILLIEPDTRVRKKLSDLLNRERMIGKNTITDALEILCKYKNEINLIITNVQVLSNEVRRQTISHLCKKLGFETPPILGFYTKEDTEHNQDFKKISKTYRLINYDEKDPGFPAEYLQVISELFPQMNSDPVQAMKTWTEDKKNEDLEDLHKWLKDEGFSPGEHATLTADNPGKTTANKTEDIESAGLLKDEPTQKQNPDPNSPADFEKMYYDLRKKYDALYQLMEELTVVLKGTKDHE